MAVKVARGQVTTIDRNDAVSLQAFIGPSQPLPRSITRIRTPIPPCGRHRPILSSPLAVRQWQGGDGPDSLDKPVGTAYTYTWKLWNSAGTAVVKTYTGKSVTVSKADVTGKDVLMCEVAKQGPLRDDGRHRPRDRER